MNADCGTDWYSNLDDNMECEDTSSSLNSPCPDTLSSVSSLSLSPAREPEKRSLAYRSNTPHNGRHMQSASVSGKSAHNQGRNLQQVTNGHNVQPAHTHSAHHHMQSASRSNGQSAYNIIHKLQQVTNGHNVQPAHTHSEHHHMQPAHTHSEHHHMQPAHTRSEHHPVQPLNIGQGIYYYGDIGPSRSAPGSPATSRGQHNYTPSNLTNGMSASHSHRHPAPVQQHHSNGHSQHASRRVHISEHLPSLHGPQNREQTSSNHPVPVATSSRSSSKIPSSSVSCYSGFSFGSHSKKHKLPKVLRRKRSKSEKEKSKQKRSPNHTAHLNVHGSSSVHPRRTHGYLSDCEGYRRSHKAGFSEPNQRHHKPTYSHGYSSDYEVVRHHKHTLQLERNAKGYSSGYETTGSYFSGSEWSEDESEIEYSNDVFSTLRRGSRTKSTGTIVLHKIAKKFGKMSIKSGGGDGGDGSDGSGGAKSSSWSAKKASKKRKKNTRSNSVSNLADADE